MRDDVRAGGRSQSKEGDRLLVRVRGEKEDL